MKPTATQLSALLVLAMLAMSGCRREEPAPAADASADASPEADLREQTGALMRGEGLRPTTPGASLDARPLAGQAEIGIRSLLGNPSACEDVQKGRKCRYAQGATDVTYIDGMADWISVEDLAGAPFSAEALARVGLPTNEDPIESTPQLIRWQNLGGFREVTLHAGPGGRAARIDMKMSTL